MKKFLWKLKVIIMAIRILITEIVWLILAALITIVLLPFLIISDRLFKDIINLSMLPGIKIHEEDLEKFKEKKK